MKSLPIAATPVLKGRAARRFLRMVEDGLKHPCGLVPTPKLEQGRQLVLKHMDPTDH